MSIFSRSLSSLLSAVLVFGPYLGAQTPAGAGDNSVQELHIRPADNTLSEYPAGSIYDKGIAVEITDQQNSPVSGVAVTFRLPESGATGVFGDGNRIAVAYTDSNGQAAVRNIQWGNTAGTLLLRITATKGIVHAGILMEQKLGAPASRAAIVEVPATPPARATASAPEAAGSPVAEPQVSTPHVSISNAPARKPAVRQAAAPANPAQQVESPQQEPPQIGQPQPGQPGASVQKAQNQTPRTAQPSVLITNAPTERTGARSSSSKKWLWIALIGAGAAGGAVAAMGKSHSAAAPSTPAAGITIGTPSVSIGHP